MQIPQILSMRGLLGDQRGGQRSSGRVEEGEGAISVRRRDMAVARSCRVLTIMEGAFTLTRRENTAEF